MRKRARVPIRMLSTCALNVLPGYASTVISTGWPARMSLACVCWHVAVTHTWPARRCEVGRRSLRFSDCLLESLARALVLREEFLITLRVGCGAIGFGLCGCDLRLGLRHPGLSRRHARARLPNLAALRRRRRAR